jgi:hypothetical protein
MTSHSTTTTGSTPAPAPPTTTTLSTNTTTRTTTIITTSRRRPRVVSFGSVEVRQYERVVGGGGHLDTLASLGIGWRYFGSETFSLSSLSSSSLPPPPPLPSLPSPPPPLHCLPLPPLPSQEMNHHDHPVTSCLYNNSDNNNNRGPSQPEELSSFGIPVCCWLADVDARVNRFMDYGLSVQEIFKAEQIFQDMAEKEEEQERMSLLRIQQKQEMNKKDDDDGSDDDSAASASARTSTSTSTTGTGKCWGAQRKATRGILKRIRMIRERLGAKRCSAASNAA